MLRLTARSYVFRTLSMFRLLRYFIPSKHRFLYQTTRRHFP